MPVERWIRRTHRRLFLQRCFHRSAQALVGLLFFVGALVLAAKLIYPPALPWALWSLAVAIPILGFVAWQVARGMPNRDASAAILDSEIKAGGLVMTLAETNGTSDPRWQRALPRTHTDWRRYLPSVGVGRFFSRLSLPLGFLLATGFIPARELKQQSQTSNKVGIKAVDELTSRFDRLRSLKKLDAETEKRLRDELKQLQAAAERGPLSRSNWEVADALKEELKIQIESAFKQSARALRAAKRLAAENTISPAENRRLREQIIAAWPTIVRELESVGNTGFPRVRKLAAGNELPDQLSLPKEPKERAALVKELAELLSTSEKQLAALGNKLGMKLTMQDPVVPSTPAGPTFGTENGGQQKKFTGIPLVPSAGKSPPDRIIKVRPPKGGSPATVSPRNKPIDLTDPANGKATWKRRLRPQHRRVMRNLTKGEK